MLLVLFQNIKIDDPACRLLLEGLLALTGGAIEFYFFLRWFIEIELGHNRIHQPDGNPLLQSPTADGQQGYYQQGNPYHASQHNTQRHTTCTWHMALHKDPGLVRGDNGTDDPEQLAHCPPKNNSGLLIEKGWKIFLLHSFLVSYTAS